MIEQELASVMKFVLEITGDPYPYYWKVPESFRVPSVYFPPPEITSGPDTLTRYSLDYAWYLKLFASCDRDAYDMAQQAVETFRRKRNLVPLITEEGEPAGKSIRLKDPSIKHLDDGVFQLVLDWTVRRNYDTDESEKMMEYEADIRLKNDELEDAIAKLSAERINEYIAANRI